MFEIYYVSFFSWKGSKVNLIENEIKYCLIDWVMCMFFIIWKNKIMFEKLIIKWIYFFLDNKKYRYILWFLVMVN